MWTKDALYEMVRERLREHKLIVVANREPYIHRFAGKRIKVMRPASGMVTALDPIVQACGGVWVAHGGGDADRRTVDRHDHVQVPPEAPRYTLRRVWLTKAEEQGYYYGFSNEALWPLCHITFTRPAFSPADWATYRDVNRKFADAVLQEAAGQPAFVFIQDYHFALLPRMLKDANPNLIVGQFWHIPWPNRETFRVFPWQEEILDGLLGNDLLGFHLRYHCLNFLDTIDRAIEARVEDERSEVTRNGKVTAVRPFPISIDFDAHAAAADGPAVAAETERWRQELGLDGDTRLGVGIERMDYTKGIPERLRGLDRFLEQNPAYREKFVFVQIAVPSRSHVPHYKHHEDAVDGLADEINWKWSTDSWRPIVLVKQHHEQASMMALHRLADFCAVTSLHDGMNLVAKEFVASRTDERGALVLSQFTGAARELTDALLVNPYAVDEVAAAFLKALEMPDAERQRRMQRMRAAVAGNNIYRWAGKALSAILRFDFPDQV